MGFQAYFFRSLTLAEGDALGKHAVSVMRQSRLKYTRPLRTIVISEPFSS